MLFNSFEFVAFFVTVYGVYSLVSHRLQLWLLLFASYFFYAAWNWKFCGLIAFSTVVDFVAGKKIQESEDKPTKRKWLYLSLIVNLGLLGFFKYSNFFIESFNDLMLGFGLGASLSTLAIVLPVGISFYTFQTLSYSLDIYKGELKPEKSFLKFAVFVSFFPQLVAGPIERASNFLPQLGSRRAVCFEDIQCASWMILLGYYLKIFVADNLGTYVDQSFSSFSNLSGGELLVALYSFSFQIFGDFAGYSFIAIGIARLMGFRLMTNFLTPYLVSNPSDFWRHWHISLSSWFRDYVYIPLGGSRGGQAILFRNVLITFVVSGFWHGAAWNFVLWGFFHGFLLIVYSVLKSYLPSFTKKLVFRLLSIFIMFQITCFGWLIFRVEELGDISSIASKILFEGLNWNNAAVYHFLNLGFYTAVLGIIQISTLRKNDNYSIFSWPPLFRGVLYAVMLLSIVCFGEFGSQEFIYFQF